MRAFILLILSAIGCSNVTFDETFGNSLANSEIPKIEGWWRVYNDEYIKVKSTKDGAILAGLDFDRPNRFEAVNFKCTFRKIGKSTFAFFETESVSGKGIFLIESWSANTLEVRFPDREAVILAISEGHLDGVIDKKLTTTVQIKSSKKAESYLSNDESVSKLFPNISKILFSRTEAPTKTGVVQLLP